MALAEKYFIVTGANAGIGLEVAKLLCRDKAHVTLACRDNSKMNETLASIQAEFPDCDVSGIPVDLADLSSVEQFAAAYIAKGVPLHTLILNAAVFMPPFTKTVDGYEMTFQVNHLAHSYLVFLLLDVLRSSAPSRVVVVASESCKMSTLHSPIDVNLDVLSPSTVNKYSPFYAYNNSKMCNVLFASELDKRLSPCGISAHSVHPGNLVLTNLSRNVWYIRLLSFIYWPLSPSPSQAAENEIFLATSDEVMKPGMTGRYWVKGIFGRYSSSPGTDEMAKVLWDLTLSCLEQKRGFTASQF